MSADGYTPIIGLEIHVELKTKSKMFCQCNADYFGKAPNSNVCPVCMGMPGALPVPNRQAVEWTIKIGQALNCTINRISKFDRKHYFYPDLPKGYQISQYDEPLCVKGSLEIVTKDGIKKKFGITRVHLEEDTGKLTHTGSDTLIDFNRSSVPLVEIVTEPDFDNPEDVKMFLEELHTIIRYLDVSDADMEKGTMRLEPNISVRKPGQTGFPPYKVEVKNINSFNFVKRAVEYELERQQEILEQGEIPEQETRGYNEDKGITYSQRSKEDAHDYRYFPEPDIPHMEFDDKELNAIKKTIPELPVEKVTRYMESLKLKYQDAFFITRDAMFASYFESVLDLISKEMGEKISKDVLPQQVANLLVNKKISSSISVEEFVKQAVLLLTPKETDTAKLQEAVEKVVADNAKVVEDYKSGKENAIMYLVGQVMKEMRDQAAAQDVRSLLETKLKK